MNVIELFEDMMWKTQMNICYYIVTFLTQFIASFRGVNGLHHMHTYMHASIHIYIYDIC